MWWLSYNQLRHVLGMAAIFQM